MDEFKLLEPVDNSKGCVVFYAEDYRTKRRVKLRVGPEQEWWRRLRGLRGLTARWHYSNRSPLHFSQLPRPAATGYNRIMRGARGSACSNPASERAAVRLTPSVMFQVNVHMNRYYLARTSATCVLLTTLLAPLAGRAAVEEPWNLPALTAAPDAILKAAAAQPSPKDGDIEMLFEEHVYHLDAEGRQHRIARRVYRYLTEKGVDDWSSTDADWSPWCEEKPVFNVRVITPDGQVHKLDPESIGEAPQEQDVPNLYSDDKLLPRRCRQSASGRSWKKKSKPARSARSSTTASWSAFC